MSINLLCGVLATFGEAILAIGYAACLQITTKVVRSIAVLIENLETWNWRLKAACLP